MSNQAKPENIALLDNLLSTTARQWGNARKLPAALRVTEGMEPAGGLKIPVYPASYPNSGGDPIYDLNGKQTDAKGETTGYLHAVIDSYQSQANRMEPAFLAKDLNGLVPQIIVKVPRKKDADLAATEDEINVLEVAHRVADFRVRLSGAGEQVKTAIKSFDDGDALPLLRLMPTSVLFGFWDSRDLGTKHARILLSRIDAFDVIPCQKHSIYSGMYSQEEARNLLPDAEATKPDNEILSGRGYTNAPGSGLGGVLVGGGITRTSVLSFTDIARIHCMNGPIVDVLKTNAARRYIFALGVLAEAFQRETGNYNLRSGCELVSVGEANYELRGGSPTPALIELCQDQAALVEIAKDAMEILGIPASKQTFSMTVESLAAEFAEAKGKKADKKDKATAKKAAAKIAAKSNDKVSEDEAIES
jgi:CRISPR-associated protein Csb1